MYGLDPITRQCTYSTPCGWCTKWDKKCDKKIGCGTQTDISRNDFLTFEEFLEQEGMKRYDQPRNN